MPNLNNAIKDIQFRIYTDAEIEKISVLKITNDESISVLGHFQKDGVYDLRLGPMDQHSLELCETCGRNGYKCSGHCGNIDLPLPVYNPFFYDQLRLLFNCICCNCCRFQVTDQELVQLTYQFKFLDGSHVEEALSVQGKMIQYVDSISDYEATELSVLDEDQDKEEGGVCYIQTGSLPKVIKHLEKYYKSVTNGENIRDASLHANEIRQQILKKFISTRKKKRCMHCNAEMITYRLQGSRFMIMNPTNKALSSKLSIDPEADQEDDKENECGQVVNKSQPYMSVEQAETILKKCWSQDSSILKLVFRALEYSEEENPTSMFFIHKLLVVPPKFRPCNFVNGTMVENAVSALYKNILQISKALTFLVSILDNRTTTMSETMQLLLKQTQGKTNTEKMQTVWAQLQANVDCIFDADMNPLVKDQKKGIKQILEKKQGLLRTNLMGKRVDYSARSVAAPDPMLSVDQVGVPMDFAKRLSYPVPVTPWNVKMLRELVLNGPLEHPGALFVEDEEGKKTKLHPHNYKQRAAIANKLLTPTESHVKKVNMHKIVYRHLEDGDYVLMNRQPTLHRPSIQAHRARVMPNDRVLRMPYANCKAYNADFDGDEMNMHFPQNELAKSESKYIITTKNQYLTPKDGSPLAGLIQDCVVAAVMLTVRGKFFNKYDYQQLLFTALSDSSDRIRCMPPSIMKPTPLWSGKQVISTILLNVIPKNKARPSFEFKTSVKVKLWETEPPRKAKGGGDIGGKRENMSESEFVMREGELLCGVVDKCAIGSSSYGLVHTCYELYGGDIATRLLSSVNRLFVYYLQWSGHTISDKEFITIESTSKERRKKLAKLVEDTPALVHKKLGLASNCLLSDYIEQVHMRGTEKDMAMIDGAYTHVLNPTVSNVTEENEEGLLRKTLDNHMRMMVDTGSKGSKINMNQMASLFGSVAIDGKRMPVGITGKSLPSFRPYEVDPRAGGFIPRRFMTGVTVQNYFFLCIVGRDSLQHTAVKTANSGYMQRCLIKHLEGISVKYDGTVRNSDGLVLQFEYGEDGMDVSKIPFFKNYDTLDSLIDNYSRLYDENTIKMASSVGNKEQVTNYKSLIDKWHKKNKKGQSKKSPFQRFCAKLPEKYIEQLNNIKDEIDKSNGRSKRIVFLQTLWYKLSKEEKQSYIKKCSKQPNPISSKFSASSNVGVLSEAMESLIEKYYTERYTKRPLCNTAIDKEKVLTTFKMKAIFSRVDPGDAVGALCAQAIGEPLTQMTLNTFHFAGRDELNVTLGVPRMVEILRTASEKISTPIMEIPFLPHVTAAEAEMLRLSFGSVTLANVLHNVEVEEINKVMSNGPSRCIRAKFLFLPYNQYKHKYYVRPAQILQYTEDVFIPLLIKAIQKSMNIRSTNCTTSSATDNLFGGNKVQSEDPDEIVEEQPIPDKETEIPGSDDEEIEDENADDVGLASSSRNKKVQEHDYSESEAEDNEDDNARPGKYADVSEDEALGSEIEDEEMEEKTHQQHLPKTKVQVSSNEELMRKNKLMNKSQWIFDYKLDKYEQLWCEVNLQLPFMKSKYDFSTLVRKTAENALVHCVKDIKRAFVEDKNGLLLLRTEGINIYKLCDYNHMLDINKLYTNNIVTIANIYGIEAAQRSIIKEIRAVQSAYDIKVDFRHLTLLADYFTCEGKYKACSRHALQTCVSPLQKMSYETTIQFLKAALVNGETEKMESPSANVAVGQPVKVGTNVMKIRPNLQAITCR